MEIEHANHREGGNATQQTC